MLILLHNDGPNNHLATQQEGALQALFFPGGLLPSQVEVFDAMNDL
jgi:hypothetical protein